MRNNNKLIPTKDRRKKKRNEIVKFLGTMRALTLKEMLALKKSK